MKVFVLVSLIFILVSSFGYLSTFARADDLKKLGQLHIKDFNTLTSKIDDNEKRRIRDALIEKAEEYTDKIHEIQTKHSKSSHDKSMLSYYKNKKVDIRTKLGNL